MPPAMAGRSTRAPKPRDGKDCVVKRAAGPYRAGKRSPEWQKLKIQQQDEFVVGGWTSPAWHASHFGALILGTAGPGGALTYVGDVGTGFPRRRARSRGGLLARAGQPTTLPVRRAAQDAGRPRTG